MLSESLFVKFVCLRKCHNIVHYIANFDKRKDCFKRTAQIDPISSGGVLPDCLPRFPALQLSASLIFSDGSPGFSPPLLGAAAPVLARRPAVRPADPHPGFEVSVQ